MSTAAQINANIANAQASTGPRTSAGQAVSSKNAITHGLFTSGDFVRPDETRAYDELNQALLHDLAPQGVLEHSLVDEIRRAMWRLRRCGQVEAHLVLILNDNPIYIMDPMETASPNAERIQKSVDRARSQAHRLLHKCTAELRKLQTERHNRGEVTEAESVTPLTPVAKRTLSQPAGTPRNAQCPCGSGQKHKRCCGKGAPAVLQAA